MTSPEATDATGPSAELLAELDARRATANASQDGGARVALMDTAVRLPAWHFLTSPAEVSEATDRGLPTGVLTFNENGKAVVPMFSTPERAAVGVKGYAGGETRDDPIVLASLPLPTGLAYVCQLNPAIEHVIIDHSPADGPAVGLEVASLPHVYAERVGTPPAECLPRMSVAINRLGNTDLFKNAYRVLAGLETLFLPCTAQGMPVLIKQQDGRITAPLFADESIARTFVAAQEQAAGLVRAKPAELAMIDSKLSEAAGKEYVGLLLNPGVAPIFVKGEWFADVHQGGAARS